MPYQMYDQDVRGLSNEAIRRAAPSVFAVEAHESRSSRYQYIPTSQLLDAYRGAGFAPVTVMQSKSRIEGKTEFTKHLLRLRRVQDLGWNKPDIREVVLVNSHDGTSAYKLYGGIFRTVCTNGLVVGDFDHQYTVQHKGDITGQVIEGTLRIIDEGEQVMDEIEQMKHIELKRPQQLLLAKYAMAARLNQDLDEEEGEVQVPQVSLYEAQDFLRPRRSADQGNDLYTTFNVLQENVIKGRVHSSHYDDKGQRRTTRAIHGIDQGIKLNKLLWSFAEELKKQLS